MNTFSLHYNDAEYDRDWSHINGETLTQSLTLEADIVIVGSGAGAGITAETLVEAGWRVIIVEEGPLRTAKNFTMQEATAYADLYQEMAGRRTADKAISILQGRSVGGSTTVNWTSSFRTPEPTLNYWADQFGVKACSTNDLAPYFDWAVNRLGIETWSVPANPNNQKLADGCAALGWQHAVIARNVRGCANLGYCGMGCPMNAKQSMLITTIPYALKNGAQLLSRVRVERLQLSGDRVVAAQASACDRYDKTRHDIAIELRARHFVMAAGAIGTPAILLRSKIPNPNERIGKRTFLHPVVMSAAIFNEEINGWSGAPQSIYSDEFVFKDGVDGACGYKLEVPPLHPVLAAVQLQMHGEEHRELMTHFPHLQVTLALTRDGFHEDSVGGNVKLDEEGLPLLDYPISDYLWDGLHRAYLTMAEVQFAAGAKQVMPLHKDARRYSNWSEAREAILQLPMKALRAQVVSAHVMGGCAMGEDEHRCVTDSQGRLRHLQNVSVHDGSLFPTSLGVNPQLSIYALIRRLSERLVRDLSAVN